MRQPQLVGKEPPVENHRLQLATKIRIHFWKGRKIGDFDLAIGVQCLAHLIPTRIGAVQLQFLRDLVGKADRVKALEELAPLVQHGLRFRRKRHAGNIAHHEIAFEPRLCANFGLGIGDEVVDQ